MRAAIYCRVSDKGRQEDNASLPTQEAACRAYCAEQGYEVVGVFSDTMSGDLLFERKGLAKARDLVKTREVEVIVCHSVDRWSRNQAHQGFLLTDAEHYGARYEFVIDNIDDTPQGRIVRSVMGVVAEIDRLKIIERTGRGIRARAEGKGGAPGKPLGGCRAPYGYQWADAEKSRLLPDPLTAPIVRRIFAEYAAGATMRAIAATLTAEGVKTATGKDFWAQSTMRDLLRHPVYVGRYTAFRYRTEKERKNGRVVVHRYDRDEEEQVALPAGTVEPLIDEATWTATRSRLERNNAEATRNNQEPESALLRAGFVLCGYCGHPMRVSPTKTGPDYRCAGTTRDRYGCPYYSIKAHILDGYVWRKARRVLEDPHQIVHEIIAAMNRPDPSSDDRGGIERQIAKLDRDEAKAARRMMAEDDDEIAARYRHELRQLLDQKKALIAECDAITAREAEREANRVRLENLMRYVGNAQASVADFTYQEKRDALAWLGIKATVRRQDDDGPRVVVRGHVDLEYFDKPLLPPYDGGRRWFVNETAPVCAES